MKVTDMPSEDISINACCLAVIGLFSYIYKSCCCDDVES
jgi:hypothetical protein